MSWTRTNRRMLASLVVGVSLLMPGLVAAQEVDDGDTPLGDVARNLRKQSPPSQQEIIDNDNLSKVMDDVDSWRPLRNSLMYSIEGPGKAFQVSAPDVTCSLSFSANVKSLLASSYVQMELPADQLLKLSGPAAIHGDSLEISVFNGTEWHVSEVAVALTVVRRTDFPQASLHDRLGKDDLAKVIPAAAIESLQEPGTRSDLPADHRGDDRSGKRPDTAVLYRMRAAAPPFGVTEFAAPLNVEIGPDQEWHWAIVQAKGYPPQHNVAQQNISDQNARAGTATPSATQTGMGQPMTPAPEAPISTPPLQPISPQGATAEPSRNAPAR